MILLFLILKRIETLREMGEGILGTQFLPIMEEAQMPPAPGLGATVQKQSQPLHQSVHHGSLATPASLSLAGEVSEWSEAEARRGGALPRRLLSFVALLPLQFMAI